MSLKSVFKVVEPSFSPPGFRNCDHPSTVWTVTYLVANDFHLSLLISCSHLLILLPIISKVEERRQTCTVGLIVWKPCVNFSGKLGETMEPNDTEWRIIYLSSFMFWENIN